MGHLMLISEDVITALARFPPDLRLIIIQYAPEPEWDQYVTGKYNETKEEDARPLGGGKPVLVGKGGRGGVMQWKIDENELGVGDGSGASSGGAGDGNGGDLRSEFRRASSVGPSGHVTSTADFGPAPIEDDDDDDDSVLPDRAPHVRIVSCYGLSYGLTFFSPLVRSISGSGNIFRPFRVIVI
jgi:serine/threonine-protein phosphatase 6 regulatory subunit 3